MPDRNDSDVAAAADRLRAHDVPAPELALILGSGLGALAEEVEDPMTFETARLPGYPRSTVEGHAGQLVFGTLEGRSVLFVRGRAHLYEGHPPRALGVPVRLAHALGARRLLVTNAAGGIRPEWAPGTLMFITDHLNFAFANPLSGAATAPQRVQPYDAAWTDRAAALARDLGIPTERGVYVWTRGPSYETEAEIRMFARLGADAVGMSTVPEALQAAALEMPVLGLSTITNAAAGLSDGPLDHDEVLETGKRVRDRLRRLVRAIVRAG